MIAKEHALVINRPYLKIHELWAKHADLVVDKQRLEEAYAIWKSPKVKEAIEILEVESFEALIDVAQCIIDDHKKKEAAENGAQDNPAK